MKKLGMILMAMAVVVASYGTTPIRSEAAGDGPPQPVRELSEMDQAQAIIVADLNQRSRGVAPGQSVLYCTEDLETCVQVTAELEYGKAGLQRPASAIWSVTQVCGINVYVYGLHMATLKNRANVTYYQDAARSPARFNWRDMSGTKTHLLGNTWQNLSQYSSPALGTKFTSSGHVQASGNLNTCYAGICTSRYFVSRLNVTTSKTYCS